MPPALTPTRLFRWLAVVVGLALVSGCFSFHREPPRPGRTKLESPLVVLSALTVSNYLVVEAKWDKHGPYHFLIDTGASVTLVSPELAARYGVKNPFPPDTPLVRVKSADGGNALLPPTMLRRLQLDGARFEDVQALIYDCAPLSAHLGMKIDAILGFPLFRETLLTLDYPHSQVILRRRSAAPSVVGSTIPFNNDRKTPIITVRLGGKTFAALIDSGSDAALSLNPVGLQPVFAVAPRQGATVGTLTGDRAQEVGRLAASLTIGSYTLIRPVADLTDELASLGGGILKNFTVTFDQEHNQVTFERDTPGPIPPEPRRSAGLSFTKTPAYWRVASVIPGSPAASAGVQPGDLVTRVNGELISKWDIRRYELLVATATSIEFTFLNGAQEVPERLDVFDLVP
ncbi:MAG: aspartyl protease family protein [Opitutaceae bacterium]